MESILARECIDRLNKYLLIREVLGRTLGILGLEGPRRLSLSFLVIRKQGAPEEPEIIVILVVENVRMYLIAEFSGQGEERRGSVFSVLGSRRHVVVLFCLMPSLV